MYGGHNMNKGNFALVCIVGYLVLYVLTGAMDQISADYNTWQEQASSMFLADQVSK